MEEFETVRETFERIDLSRKDTAGMEEKGGYQAAQAVYIKKIPCGESCRVLCYSEGREQKERAINDLQEKRFLEAFTRIQKSVAKGSILLTKKVAERVGRLVFFSLQTFAPAIQVPA